MPLLHPTPRRCVGLAALAPCAALLLLGSAPALAGTPSPTANLVHQPGAFPGPPGTEISLLETPGARSTSVWIRLSRSQPQPDYELTIMLLFGPPGPARTALMKRHLPTSRAAELWKRLEAQNCWKTDQGKPASSEGNRVAIFLHRGEHERHVSFSAGAAPSLDALARIIKEFVGVEGFWEEASLELAAVSQIIASHAVLLGLGKQAHAPGAPGAVPTLHWTVRRWGKPSRRITKIDRARDSLDVLSFQLALQQGNGPRVIGSWDGQDEVSYSLEPRLPE